ncbi:MAG: hypothetical protein C5B50_21105 [Verrucomicrobia bacterium]|nr:MAG: hypothetical protein C5B50_21105 [Verrucomicrobiota bacterium]
MQNTFEILAGFLERVEGEVEGHELQEMAPDLKTRVREFARGKLPEAQQKEIMSVLSQNPHWIGLLAEEIKALREQRAKG